MSAAVSFSPFGDGAAAAIPLIKLEGVAKDYDTGGGVVRALRDVDLTINQGEFVAIVGTSGSGKSTLMNILGCLDRPTRGRYVLADVEVGERGNDARAIVRNRLVGFIFQGFNLLPRTTALENVELPLQYRGAPAKVRRKRATEALAAVGLQERLDHTPNMLSGGQQQRVAIARALVTDPPLLLADEPTGNLDTRTSLEVLALLQGLNRDRGITIVLVTHEHDIARCASRVITFRDGYMVSDIRQEAPLNAAKELAELPPPQTYEALKDAETAVLKQKRRAVPPSIYAMMAVGTLVGAILGSVYSALVVGQMVPGASTIFGFLAEGAFASWMARRSLGRKMFADEKWRAATYYSLGELVLLVPLVAFFGVSKLPANVRALLESHGAIAILIVLVLLVVSSLVRFLTMTLFSKPVLKRAS